MLAWTPYSGLFQWGTWPVYPWAQATCYRCKTFHSWLKYMKEALVCTLPEFVPQCIKYQVSCTVPVHPAWICATVYKISSVMHCSSAPCLNLCQCIKYQVSCTVPVHPAWICAAVYKMSSAMHCCVQTDVRSHLQSNKQTCVHVVAHRKHILW